MTQIKMKILLLLLTSNVAYCAHGWDSGPDKDYDSTACARKEDAMKQAAQRRSDIKRYKKAMKNRKATEASRYLGRVYQNIRSEQMQNGNKCSVCKGKKDDIDVQCHVNLWQRMTNFNIARHRWQIGRVDPDELYVQPLEVAYYGNATNADKRKFRDLMGKLCPKYATAIATEDSRRIKIKKEREMERLTDKILAEKEKAEAMLANKKGFKFKWKKIFSIGRKLTREEKNAITKKRYEERRQRQSEGGQRRLAENQRARRIRERFERRHERFNF